MRDNIYVAGHGKLATKIQADLQKIAQQHHLTIDNVSNWDHRPTDDTDTSRIVCIHVGSGKQFQEVFSYCQHYHTPLFQCSTGIAYPESLFSNIPFIFIDAPNFSLMIVKFLYMLEEMGSLFHDYDISITESHQSAKTSLPGTAAYLAKLLGVAPRQINSIRDKGIQSDQLKIPRQYLEQHALHIIDIGSNDCRISFKTEIYGLDSYLVGIVKLLQNIDKLSPGKYRLPDLIRDRIF